MRLERAKILVVDDRPDNIIAMEAVLSGSPEYEIVTAESGEAVLRRVGAAT